jgi:hypothetical protein
MTLPAHVPPPLNDAELVSEMERLHAARVDTLRHGADAAVANSAAEIAALESEYLRRHPDREISASRLRHPLRERTSSSSGR